MKKLFILIVSMVVLLSSALGFLTSSTTVKAEEGSYRVHYETFISLYEEDAIADMEGVSWDQTGLGFSGDYRSVEEIFEEYGYDFKGWYTDEDLTTVYADQSYGQLAGGDTSVQEVTLYAWLDFEDCLQQKTYHPWTDRTSLPDEGGDYWLVYDVTLEDTDSSALGAWTAPPGTTDIDLHGRTIRRQADPGIKGSVIYVPSGADLAVGNVTGDGGITGGNAENGGGVLVEGTFSMPYGWICGNTAENGGGIAVTGSGKANLRRVQIEDNTAVNGGGIAVLGDNGKVSLTGSVSNNTVVEDGKGGGVYIAPESGSFSLGVQEGSGWFVDSAALPHSVVVSGNKAGDTDSDIWISGSNGPRITVDTVDAAGSSVGITADPWPAQYSQKETVLTYKLETKPYDYFFVNDSRYEIRLTKIVDRTEAAVASLRHKVTYTVDGEIYQEDWVFDGMNAVKPDDPEKEGSSFKYWVTENDGIPYDFDAPVTQDVALTAVFENDHFHNGTFYKPWTATDSLPRESGHYYLTGDVQLNSVWFPKTDSQDIHICLNGHSIEGGNNECLMRLNSSGEYSGVTKNLEIYDCSEGETGCIKGRSDAGCVISILHDSSFKLHGGTIYGSENAHGSILHVYTSGSNLVMDGGTLTGNSVAEDAKDEYGDPVNGSAVWVDTSGTFTMSGGTITGNTISENGKGGVFVSESGTMNIKPIGKDIRICGNTAGTNENNVYLECDDEPQVIHIIGDGILTGDSSIFVTAEKNPAEEEPVVITSGLSGKGGPENFGSDNSEYSISVNEEGEAVLEYVPPVSIAEAEITGIEDKAYTGKAIKQDLVVKLGDTVLDADIDYTVAYENNIQSGTATVTITGTGNYTGTVSKTFMITPKKITPEVTLAVTSCTWNDKVRQPGVTVKDGSKKLASSQYTVTYASGRKNVGKYNVKVTLKGNYSGSKTVSFKIKPKGTALGNLTPASKAVTVKWTKQAEKMSAGRITGYQIQLATDSKFTQNKKLVTVKGYSTVSKKVTGLKGGKKYYVRIRTYKSVSGTNYFSSWSKAKTVTTKK